MKLPDIKKEGTLFIMRYCKDNPDWKTRLIDTYNHSTAKGVFMVRDELMGESVPVMMLDEILKEIILHEYK